MRRPRFVLLASLTALASLIRHRHRGGISLAVVLLLAACSNASSSPSTSSGEGAQIPQPTVSDMEVADEADRVDLAMPTFSNPTEITNPLFPVALESSNLLVGTIDEEPFRTEVTVLPETRTVEWEGQQVEVVVSQYNAFVGGRMEEVAYDLYAQADDGSVWYFGEDVSNFADGEVADTEGTWHAGTDGPAAMIMPANPQVGDVYRPENIPGLVFEEVVVKSTDEALDGPFGPIEHGLLVEEHHADGANENKNFAPTYGEFYTSTQGEVEALAMAVPPDGASGSEPESLTAATASATDAVQAALDGDAARMEELAADIESSLAELGDGEIPALLGPLLADGVDAMATAASDGDEEATTQATIDVARLINDLTLRYRPIPEVDVDRIGLWGAQLILDAGAEDLAGVRSDTFAVGYASERNIAADVLAQVNAILDDLHSAIDAEDYAAITDAGQALRELAGDIGS